MRRPLTALGVVAMLALAACDDASDAGAQAGSASRSGWLMGAEDDAERFALLQRYLRGFDQPMWEVGERYGRVHEALSRSNHELALYHWDKIKTTIENGYLKRPKRRKNADALFLNAAWSDARDAFASKDPAMAWTGFEQARAACQACHVAEEVPFMNGQPVFDLRAPDAHTAAGG